MHICNNILETEHGNVAPSRNANRDKFVCLCASTFVWFRLVEHQPTKQHTNQQRVPLPHMCVVLWRVNSYYSLDIIRIVLFHLESFETVRQVKLYIKLCKFWESPTRNIVQLQHVHGRRLLEQSIYSKYMQCAMYALLRRRCSVNMLYMYVLECKDRACTCINFCMIRWRKTLWMKLVSSMWY